MWEQFPVHVSAHVSAGQLTKMSIDVHSLDVVWALLILQNLNYYL